MTSKRCVIWCAVSSEEQAKGDKLSLSTQESEMRAFADAQGWDIAQVFLWDGYSRWESDPIAALEDYAEQGRFEYHELRRMWRERAFDVLLLYTHSRAGRSFTMQSWVVENVIRHGGEVYRIHGGWINKHDYAFQIGIGGVLSTNDIDRLREQRHHAMNARAARGLPTTAKPLFSHVVRRDEFGKPLRDTDGKLLPMVVNPKLRRLWDDAADLLLEGVSFKMLEAELYRRFGHVTEDGAPYVTNCIRFALYSPTFWGHSARYHNTGKLAGRKHGEWVFDDALSPPDGVLLYRHTHEAVYTGALADSVRAELQRRETVARGRSSSRHAGRFTGLLICAECTYYYGYERKGKYVYLYCGARNVGTYRSRPCGQTKGVSEAQVQRFLNALLERALDAGALEAALALPEPDDRAAADRAERIAQELADLESQAQRLVVKQTSAPEALSHVYDAEITRVGERYTILRAALQQAEHSRRRAEQESAQERQALAELSGMGLPVFWEQPDNTINQLLHRIFGNRRLAVADGQILPRLVDKPPAKRA